ncbi:MAG: DUF2442 domain-containing protein [Chitinispirillaceae bacterium]|nr:DUF2442 domain-containing protein [Chitinispirillaceae bacterium]
MNRSGDRILNPRIKTCIPKDDYRLKLVFANGEQGVFDCRPLLDFGVFSELKDLSDFKMAKASNGTVVWPHEQDICPDTLYLDSRK